MYFSVPTQNLFVTPDFRKTSVIEYKLLFLESFLDLLKITHGRVYKLWVLFFH